MCAETIEERWYVLLVPVRQPLPLARFQLIATTALLVGSEVAPCRDVLFTKALRSMLQTLFANRPFGSRITYITHQSPERDFLMDMGRCSLLRAPSLAFGKILDLPGLLPGDLPQAVELCFRHGNFRGA